MGLLKKNLNDLIVQKVSGIELKFSETTTTRSF